VGPSPSTCTGSKSCAIGAGIAPRRVAEHSKGSKKIHLVSLTSITVTVINVSVMTGASKPTQSTGVDVMKKSQKIDTFQDFWPEYLRAHESRASRIAHFVGILLSLVLAAALVSCGMVFFLLLATVPAQIGAWLGHKLSPRKDRVSDEHPDWAALADLKMFGLALTGRLGGELRTALATN
jgi:hypothetical protein